MKSRSYYPTLALGAIALLAGTALAATSGEPTGLFQSCCSWLDATLSALKSGASGLVEQTSSPLIRSLFIYLLGILMSLTPCIYPMIPITVGILQTTASSSLWRNFLLAGTYTLGIASTFAALGFLAAIGSAKFGMLLGNPWFVAFLVIFLVYLAFSMLGLYELHVPQFMQSPTGPTKGGSFISAFLMGAISGTVASPCLSPGLVLLLSIVATLGSKLLGFTYLFIFGLGLGTPLLIIGTFSNSINMLPRAGSWMMEIKKVFGILLISMALYYISSIAPLWLTLKCAALGAGISSWIYFRDAHISYSRGLKRFQMIIAIILGVATIALAGAAGKAYFSQPKTECPRPQACLSYEQAKAQAVSEHKLLLIDFGASWCSSCRIFEHTIMSNPSVIEQLPQVIMVSIDCTNPQEETCAKLQENFEVRGFPTVILMDPSAQTIKARWTGEVAEMTPERFVAAIRQHQ